MTSRRFNWLSSSDEKNSVVLKELNNKMMHFYSSFESRQQYQQMVDNNDNDLNNPGIVTESFIKYLDRLAPKKMLEVGCGSGRIYQFIQKHLTEVEYTGVEVSKNIIEKNRLKYTDANWLDSDAYKIPVDAETMDVCFSLYVLEHLVFPEKALNEMMRTVKHGGYLILIFPDFSISGRFASQNIGLSDDPTAITKLKKGRFFDAVISLYDSRIRLPNALKNAVKQYGDFPVNLNPKCLSASNTNMSPDVDAVYIASKKEIENWAQHNGFIVSYPAGTEGYFAEHGFISIQKTA